LIADLIDAVDPGAAPPNHRRRRIGEEKRLGRYPLSR
jgi:hypothetical protein